MLVFSLTSFFYNAMCGASTGASLRDAPPVLTQTLSKADNTTITTATAEWPPFLSRLAEVDDEEERCTVWATNLLVTLCLALVVLLRIWWTCGNLPPSDVLYEPALGRVLSSHPATASTATQDETAIEDEEVAAEWTAVYSRRVRHRGAPVEPARSAARLCRFSYLSAAELATAEEALPLSSPQPSSFQVEPTAKVACWPLLRTFARCLHSTEAVQRIWKSFSSWPMVCWIVLRQRTMHAGVRAVVAACADVYAALVLVFSLLFRLSPIFSSCGQHAYPRRGRHAPPPLLPPQQNLNTSGPRCAAEQKGAPVLPDQSDDDDEAEELQAVQEELWGILEGIERRRRALTGRNLFRQPLPQRRMTRWGSRAGEASATATAHTTRGSATPRVAAAAAAAAFPALATGIALSFSTDRTRRPAVLDRHGRWIPVAVIDEEGEYYNYNLDLVLPVN